QPYNSGAPFVQIFTFNKGRNTGFASFVGKDTGRKARIPIAPFMGVYGVAPLRKGMYRTVPPNVSGGMGGTTDINQFTNRAWPCTSPTLSAASSAIASSANSWTFRIASFPGRCPAEYAGEKRRRRFVGQPQNDCSIEGGGSHVDRRTRSRWPMPACNMWVV